MTTPRAAVGRAALAFAVSVVATGWMFGWLGVVAAGLAFALGIYCALELFTALVLDRALKLIDKSFQDAEDALRR